MTSNLISMQVLWYVECDGKGNLSMNSLKFHGFLLRSIKSKKPNGFDFLAELFFPVYIFVPSEKLKF